MTHTLLLADDSVTIQRVIELTFAEEDVDVIAVSDGDQAIKRLETAPPDIVLADIGMPGRDGYEVARYIRQNPKLSHIPVVLLTGAFEPVDQAKAAEVGCDGVLTKPFEPQLVIGRVRELLMGGPRGASKPLEAALIPEKAAPDQGVAVAESAENLDEYFDQLDTAFANLGGASTVKLAPERASAPVVPEPPEAPERSAAELRDSLETLPTAQPSSDPELPLSYASPAPPMVEARHGVVAPPAPEPPAPPPPAPEPSRDAARDLPSVSDAFAAILAAEQAESGASARPVWPVTIAPARAVSAEISDDLIEQIVQRVLAKISVGDRVAAVAERLVREEIERIKASIK